MRTLASCLLLVTGAAFAGFTPPQKLTVVTDDNYPPYLFRDGDGSLQGIIKDKWELWSARTGVPVVIEGIPWAKAQEAALAGRADVIDAIAFTDARRTLYEFSPAYAAVDSRVYFHHSVSGINDVASMRGFTIGAKAGSACGRWLAERGSTLRNYDASEALVKAASAGEVRLFCMDAPTAQYFLFKLGRADDFRETPPLYSASLHWAVRAGQGELRDFVRAGFDRVGGEALDAIDARWMGSPVKMPLGPKYIGYFVLGLATLVGITALLLLWNRSLRVRVSARTEQLHGAMSELERQAEHARDLYDTAPCGYHSLDMEGRYVEVNDTELRWLGLDRHQVIGRHFGDFLTEDGRNAFRTNFSRFLEAGELHGIEYDLKRADGTMMKILLSATLRRDERGQPVMSNATIYDITERALAEERVAHLSNHDSLTGLPNRLLLRDRIQQAISQAHRAGGLLAVCFLDVDRFKTINDSLGQASGDRLLQAVGRRLAETVREGDTVSRVGGDGFVVCVTEVESVAHASSIGAAILESIGAAFEVDGHRIHITASLGIGLYPTDGTAAEMLIRHAETAMYHAKDAGRGTFQFFAEHMNVATQQRLFMEAGLRRGLERGEFELAYQPIFDVRGQPILGLEALLRWHPPGSPVIAPAEFIGVAEESRLIVPIGEWVLRESLGRARRWQAARADFKLSVNVSAHQLSRADFFDRLSAILRETGVDPRRLEMEVTESVIIESAGTARESIDRIAGLGVGIAIDYFGTGYAGLGYLKRLPIHKLKIDQSFVRNMLTDRGDAAIVAAVIAMARGLGVSVVAEGVETAEQLAELRRLGCDGAQGYLFARPQAADKIERLFAADTAFA